MPLEKLKLNISGKSLFHAEPDVPIGLRVDEIATGIREVLLGIRTPAETSANWPSIVEYGRSTNKLSLLKSYDPNGGGWHYRQSRDQTE
jgi:hypothetical protein